MNRRSLLCHIIEEWPRDWWTEYYRSKDGQFPSNSMFHASSKWYTTFQYDEARNFFNYYKPSLMNGYFDTFVWEGI